MKLLVLSDSHGNIERMIYAVEYTKPDIILHLGDQIMDAVLLQSQFPNTTFHAVKGNCDFNAFGDIELLLTFDGVKVFMTHGHTYRVKNGLAEIIEAGRKKGADIALFGHTHIAMIQQAPGLFIMNPGQLQHNDSYSRASYGVVTVVKDSFECNLFECGSGKPSH